MTVKLTPNTTVNLKGKAAIATINTDEADTAAKMDAEKEAIARWASEKGLEKVQVIEETPWRHHTLWESYWMPVAAYL